MRKINTEPEINDVGNETLIYVLIIICTDTYIKVEWITEINGNGKEPLCMYWSWQVLIPRLKVAWITERNGNGKDNQCVCIDHDWYWYLDQKWQG